MSKSHDIIRERTEIIANRHDAYVRQLDRLNDAVRLSGMLGAPRETSVRAYTESDLKQLLNDAAEAAAAASAVTAGEETSPNAGRIAFHALAKLAHFCTLTSEPGLLPMPDFSPINQLAELLENGGFGTATPGTIVGLRNLVREQGDNIVRLIKEAQDDSSPPEAEDKGK